MDIAAYLCTKIVDFYGANFYLRPLTEVGTFFCCPVYDVEHYIFIVPAERVLEGTMICAFSLCGFMCDRVC